LIRSMTGFGDASSQIDGVHYALEVRSLNGKYFKSTIRLPEDLQGLEAELESALRRRLTRGTVTLIARCTDSSADAALEVNHEALSRYIEQVQRTKQIASGDVRLDVGPLLALPGVLQTPANEEARLEAAREAFGVLLTTAVEELIRMREREGALVLTELRSHADQISERLARIAARAPSVVEEYHLRLRQRIDGMLSDAGLNVEPADLIREIAIYAERTDVAEEVQRLTGHIEQFRELIGSQDDRPIGRTLDFLAQEMLREANTIASKSNDAAISRDIVEIKSAIDRIKEQVQNVE
jgi:uncharacterized protein (TIGR00255 family)